MCNKIKNHLNLVQANCKDTKLELCGIELKVIKLLVIESKFVSWTVWTTTERLEPRRENIYGTKNPKEVFEIFGVWDAEYVLSVDLRTCWA